MEAYQEYDRQKLYEDVWAEPRKTLAERYRVSDVAIGKVCRRLGIPVPGRGYWARKAVGRAGKRPKLPATIPCGAQQMSFRIR